MSFLLLCFSLTGLEEESPINMEQFQATVDRFTDLKKTLSFPEHESPGTSPQLSRKIVQPAPQKDPEKNMNKKSGMIKIIYMKEPELLFRRCFDDEYGIFLLVFASVRILMAVRTVTVY